MVVSWWIVFLCAVPNSAMFLKSHCQSPAHLISSFLVASVSHCNRKSCVTSVSTHNIMGWRYEQCEK